MCRLCVAYAIYAVFIRFRRIVNSLYNKINVIKQCKLVLVKRIALYPGEWSLRQPVVGVARAFGTGFLRRGRVERQQFTRAV